MKIPPTYRGHSFCRTKSNPAELAFAEAWAAFNTANPHLPANLDLILNEDGSRHPAQTPPEIRKATASVVQWLGSPVGMSFLLGVIEKSPELRGYIADAFKEKRSTR